MAADRKRIWLFAILLALLLGLRGLSRVWLAGAPGQGRVAAGPSSTPSDSLATTPAAAASAPTTSGAAGSISPVQMSEATAHQTQVLDQILVSRNDNDPRLDTELRHLDEESKAAFRAKYRALAPEKHNERGTIVFLLGRNLTTAQDYTFLKEVLSEPPCLGVEDCTKPTESSLGEQDHQSNAAAIVLVYPQLTALKALQKNPPTSDSPPAIREAAQAAVAAARASRSTLVSQAAEKNWRALINE